MLLGDPGAGKTTTFRSESKESGGRYVVARAFVRGDCDDVADGTGATFFIDGLDEVRTGGGDPRLPLDKIVDRLRKLGSPRLRISCRPADWGLADANALQSLLGGSPFPVLRLDPLRDDDIRDILQEMGTTTDLGGPEEFVCQAMDRGLGGLLGNPQSLKMLANAVGSGRWPTSRSELFEIACGRLVQERNREHLDARTNCRTPTSDRAVLEAASRLSALFLLTDAHAICRHAVQKIDGDLALEEIEGATSDALRHALRTGMFAVQSPGSFVPVHRHVAEYLAARHLRDLVASDHGPPVSRVLALLAGHDGGVVPGLRGVAGWLASLCPKAKTSLIDADPIGVVAYGDAGALEDADLARLVHALERKSRQVSRQAWSAAALGALIRPSAVKLFCALVAERTPTDARQRIVDLLLRGVPHAASNPFGGFIDELLRLARSTAWRPSVRYAALHAALDTATRTDAGFGPLDVLLQDVKSGQVRDPDNELRGRLLTAMYPGRIGPERIWDYLPQRANRSLYGFDRNFWSRRLDSRTPDAALPALLDAMSETGTRLRAVLWRDEIDRLATRFLARALDAHGENIPAPRLSKWIEFAARHSSLNAARRETPERERIRSWFAAHPELARLLQGQAPYVDASHRANVHRSKIAVVRERPRSEDHEYMAHVRQHADAVAKGTCQPSLLDSLAQAYFGLRADALASSPIDALHAALGSDERLVSATLSGFKRVFDRTDLPTLNEIVRLDEDGKRSLFALPMFAGLEEWARTMSACSGGLTEDGIKRSVAFYYLTWFLTRGSAIARYRQVIAPAWYSVLVESHPRLVAESLVAVHASKIRRKKPCGEHLAPLVQDDKHEKVAKFALPPLLRGFPVRCTAPQLTALRWLLWGGLRHMPKEVASLAEVKLARRSMVVGERVLWLAAGMLASPDRHLKAAMDFIGEGSAARTRHMVRFIAPDLGVSLPMAWDAEHFAMAIRGLGAVVRPQLPSLADDEMLHVVTDAEAVAHRVDGLMSLWLRGLADDPGSAAMKALQSLAEADELSAWRDKMRVAQDEQAVLRRGHLHRAPTVDEVQRVLQDAQPAGAADLAALVVDRLNQLALNIRDGNTDDWRQYWNLDAHGRPTKPRHEEVCRDALLSALRHILPEGVDAQPEGHCADDKRADIRVAYKGFAVPVEVKKDAHPRVWSAIADQLIPRYARDPASCGFGVYLVLWFGADGNGVSVPPQRPDADAATTAARKTSEGGPPKTPKEMQDRLEIQVPQAHRRKIKVVVVDVSYSHRHK